jgi:hypothetical protein
MTQRPSGVLSHWPSRQVAMGERMASFSFKFEGIFNTRVNKATRVPLEFKRRLL